MNVGQVTDICIVDDGNRAMRKIPLTSNHPGILDLTRYSVCAF